MYEDQPGFVYSPTKNPHTNDFEQYFFEWPTERDKLLDHVTRLSATHEVYYCPSLFKERSSKKEEFKGTYFVWVDFDGQLPTANSVPEPSLKIQSSTTNHQHWYWKLEYFMNGISVVEDISQRLAYHMDADLSGWDANQVLRPPSTTHHESGLTVCLLRWDPRPTPIELFAHLPTIPTKLLQEDDIKYIPVALEVIARYKWEDENFKFFMEKNMDKGTRSSALTKLGHICIEMGMTNAETLSLLLSADGRWKKFSRRQDQKKYLLGIINYCRAKHPVDPVEEETEKRLRVYTYEEFINTTIKIDWVVEGLLHKKGILGLSGPPDIGKSQVSIRFAESLAKGEPFLQWHIERPMRNMFVSMEMPYEELHYIIEQMGMKDNELLRENLLLLPLGSSIRLASKASQKEIIKMVEEFEPEGIIFDSLGVAIADDINSEKIILEAFDFIARLRNHFDLFTWFIHHYRKPQIGNKKTNKLEDMFGSQYIGAALTSGVGLWPVGSEIEVSCLKLRMAEKFKPFRIRRRPGINFEVTEPVGSTKDQPIFGQGIDQLGDSL